MGVGGQRHARQLQPRRAHRYTSWHQGRSGRVWRKEHLLSQLEGSSSLQRVALPSWLSRHAPPPPLETRREQIISYDPISTNFVRWSSSLRSLQLVIYRTNSLETEASLTCPCLSQMDPYCNTPYHILRFIVIVSHLLKVLKVVCCLQVLYQNPVLISFPHHHICNIPSSLTLLTLITRISAPSSLQIMKILIMQYFPYSCYVHPLMHKHHISGHTQVGLYVLVFMCETNCSPYIKQRTELDLNSTVAWFSLVQGL